jgi:hypothetical protein
VARLGGGTACSEMRYSDAAITATIQTLCTGDGWARLTRQVKALCPASLDSQHDTAQFKAATWARWQHGDANAAMSDSGMPLSCHARAGLGQVVRLAIYSHDRCDAGSTLSLPLFIKKECTTHQNTVCME